MKKKNTIPLFTVLVFIIPVTAWALVNWYEKKAQGLPVIGKTTEHRISDFQLIDQDGQLKTTADWNNKIVIQ